MHSFYPVLPTTTVEYATQRMHDAVMDLGDGEAREAEHLATRLVPDQWPLEWCLPFWLGHDFGLAEAVWQQLVIVNLLGMGHVRLADDLVDETLDGQRWATKAALARRLLEASTGQLQALFAPESLFWVSYDVYLAQWRQSGEDEDVWRDGSQDRLVENWQWLAWRGAPVKITATGACLLASRAAVIAPLETCIDHTMAATVLLDHADDWPEDLANNDFNAYVAWLSDLPKQAPHARSNRQQVLSALMQGDGARHQSYYGLIDRHLVDAREGAGQVGSAGLSAYIERLRHNAQAQGAGQFESARGAFQEALASLLADFDS